MQIVLNAILFCLILALCGVCFAVGFCLGFKKKIKPVRKEMDTQEKEKAERRKREEENFWNYNGNPQDTI